MSIFRRGDEKIVISDKDTEREVRIISNSIRMYVPDMEEFVVECSGSIDSPAPLSPRSPGMEQEKRIRREIANSNERRRMQSINAGFQSLRTLLPHHEGEKLSKAAILQQTAEYIYQLEQEKTRLLSQNCQLKRVINVHEGELTAPSSSKKRKVDAGGKDTHATDETSSTSQEPAKYKIVISSSGVVCVNESSADEGIGSMSPEPVDVSDQNPEALRKEMIELRMQLDRERRLRLQLEEQVRSLEAQLYPERIREITQQVQLQYQQILPDSLDSSESGGEGGDKLDAIPQTVEEEFLQVSPPPSPSAPTIVAIEDPLHDALQDRLPSVLEAAIKAEPKVEVEPAPRIPTPTSVGDDGVQTRLYAPSTSRQNLETIVEAIRHLEGDHLFSDEPPQQQEMPLALTTGTSRMLKVEVSPMDLGYRPATTTVLRTGNQIILPASALIASSHAQQQQQRPGVIVVKHT